MQFFIYLNVFLVGVVATIAVQHALAHFRPQHHEEEKEKPHTPAHTPPLPPAMRQHLLDQAKTNFEATLNRTATEFGHELTATSTQLNKELEKLGQNIIDDELKRYHASLDQLRQAAETTIKTASADIDTHQADLKTKLQEEMAAEKERLIQQIDTRLADAVMSFLVETLGHDVDLGAQSNYLVKLLDEHKDELKKGVADA